MTDTVWKFELKLTDEQTIVVTEDARILSAQMQFDKLCVWVRLNPQTPQQQRRIFVHGTGHDVSHYAGRHLGTVQIGNGTLVFHVFEEAH